MLRKKADAQLIRSSSRELIYFPIYAPWTVDTWEDAILPESLMLTAHEWMTSGRAQNVDVQHDGIQADAAICESFISIPQDPRFPMPGTWAGAMRLKDPALQAGVEMGVINGVSLEIDSDPMREDGLAVTRTRYPTLVANPVSAKGSTEQSFSDAIEPHVHPLGLEFDGRTRIMPTLTGETMGHKHEVFQSTATEMAQGHTHPIDFFKLDIQYVSKLQLVSWMTKLSVIAISLVEHGANWMPITQFKRAEEVLSWPGK